MAAWFHNSVMEEFSGKKYELVSTENFEDYLKLLGYGYLLRATAMKSKPVHSLTQNANGIYTFTMDSLMASTSNTFMLGVEFEEEMPPNAHKVRSVVRIDGNVMTHKQTEVDSGRVSCHVRTFYPDRMVTKTTVEGWDKVVTRTYRLIPQKT